LRRFWPEQLAALGGLGWYVAGPTLVVVVLLSLCAVARLWLAWEGLSGLWRAPSPARA
jgi:hypothetical protein